MKSREAESEIVFTKALETDLLHGFAPPKNPKLLLLPENRAPCNRLLPEDCRYQPKNLVKLFRRANVTLTLVTLMKPVNKVKIFGSMSSWDDDGGFPGTFNDGNAFSDVGKSKYICLSTSSGLFLLSNLDYLCLWFCNLRFLQV